MTTSTTSNRPASTVRTARGGRSAASGAKVRRIRSTATSPIPLLALAVLATLLVLSSRQNAVPAEASKRLGHADNPALGPADARVTAVEFFDPECEACRVIEPDLMRLLDEYGG